MFEGEYLIEIFRNEELYKTIEVPNFITRYGKIWYIFDYYLSSLRIGIPKHPNFPTPLVLENDFVSNNTTVTDANLQAALAVSKVLDQNTHDGRIRRYRSTTFVSGPKEIDSFVFYYTGNTTPISAVNVAPFELEDVDQMYVTYSILMRW